MMNAKEAKELSAQNKHKVIAEQMAEVLALVASTAESGKFGFYYDRTLYPECVEQLDKLGYKLDNKYTLGVGTMINWY